MRIKRLAALSLAAVLTAAMLTGCPWDKSNAGPSDLPDSSSRPVYDGSGDDDDSGSAPSSSTPDENNKVSVENGKLTVQAGVTELTAEDITPKMKAVITEVTLNSVKVGPGTFKGCNNLTTVTITGGSLNTDSSSKNSPFYCCDKLTTVTLSDVTINGSYTFYCCESLHAVNLNNVNIENAKSTFYGCSALTKVIGANTLKTIPESMFANCSSLQYIDISRATTIGSSTFWGCNSLEHIRVGTELKSIGKDAFKQYDSNYASVPMELTVHCTGSEEDAKKLKEQFEASGVGYYGTDYPIYEDGCDETCWNKIVNENQPDGSDAGDALARHFGLTLPL